MKTTPKFQLISTIIAIAMIFMLGLGQATVTAQDEPPPGETPTGEMPIDPNDVIEAPLDYNHKGCADLAVSVIGEDQTSPVISDFGQVHLLLGQLASGLGGAGSTIWHQDTTVATAFWNAEDQRETDDQFGEVLDWGDFNGDGYHDLAIGIPAESVGSLETAGAVQVFYGSKNGFSGKPDGFFTQDSDDIAGAAEANDEFGNALAAGDFDGDGFDDLAIGSHYETVNGVGDAGMVTVLYGDASGLNGIDSTQVHQDTAGMTDQAQDENDYFGGALAAGDMNGDGRDDLAVGEPGALVSGKDRAGAVTLLFGSANGITTANNILITQLTSNVDTDPEVGDNFGEGLVMADFNGSGSADLVIGTPHESDSSGHTEAGMITIIQGIQTGISTNTIRNFFQGIFCDATESNDNFGSVMAVGNFNGDDKPDLAIGVPMENNGTVHNMGMVTIVYSGLGGQSGLSTSGARCVSPAHIFNSGNQANDQFGYSLGAGDFDCDLDDDLAIGSPGRAVNGKSTAGAVVVLNGSRAGVTLVNPRLLHQDSSGVVDEAEDADWFGTAVAAAPSYWRYLFMPIARKK